MIFAGPLEISGEQARQIAYVSNDPKFGAGRIIRVIAVDEGPDLGGEVAGGVKVQRRVAGRSMLLNQTSIRLNQDPKLGVTWMWILG